MTAKPPRYCQELSNAPLEQFLAAAAAEFIANPPCLCGDPSCVETSALLTTLVRTASLAHERLLKADPDKPSNTRLQEIALVLGGALAALLEGGAAELQQAVILNVARYASDLCQQRSAAVTRQ